MTKKQTETKFKETEIGLIPEDWEVKELGELVIVKSGKRLPKGKRLVTYKTKHPYIRVCDLCNKSVKVSDVLFIDDETYKKISKYIITKDDVYVSIVGTIGLVGTIPEELDNANLTENCARLTDIKNTMKEWISYFLNTKKGQEQIFSLTVGTTQGKLALYRIKKIKIPLPPLPEQRAIAKILSDLDAKIELNHEMNKTLEAIGQAIFKHWFIDFEFPNEEGKPYKSSGGEMVYNEELGKEIPKGWKVGKIQDVASNKKNAIVDGPFGTQMKIKEYQNKGIPVIEMEYLEGYPFYKPFKNFISEKKFEEVKRSCVKKGDIVISKTGTLGLLGIMTDIYDEAVLVSRLAKISIDENKIGRYYLFLFLKLLYKEKYWDQISSGSTMPIINLGHIKSKEIIIPDKETLDKFETILETLYNSIFEHLLESQTLSAIRDSLLPKLMSGKIRVPIEVKT